MRTIQLNHSSDASVDRPTASRRYRSRSCSSAGGSPPVNAYILSSASTSTMSSASSTVSGDSTNRAVRIFSGDSVIDAIVALRGGAKRCERRQAALPARLGDVAIDVVVAERAVVVGERVGEPIQ